MKLRTKKNEAKITLSGTTEGYRENEQEKGENKHSNKYKWTEPACKEK